jgi:multiple sugar transport system ATP-binding protein
MSKLFPPLEPATFGKDVILGIRPEDIHDEPLFLDFSPEAKIRASIEVAELMGAENILYSKVNGQDFVPRVDARFNVVAGETIDLAFDHGKAHFFDCESELRIK